MRILMFGWEFPPFYSGGLGTACYGLTKGLTHKGISITFVMPNGPKGITSEYVNLIVANNLFLDKINIKIKKIDSLLKPYLTSREYDKLLSKVAILKGSNSEILDKLYGKNIYEEVYRFSEKAKIIAQIEDFDIIHCHDWMTFTAGIKAKEVSGKPLIVQIHATEFDRTGGNNVNQYVYDLEKEGMQKADKVIAVSDFTKNKIMQHYGIPESKIEVVHNAVEFNKEVNYKIENTDKIVLFLGRITLQKGPDYFIEAAKRVLDYDPNVKFIIVGTGDMEGRMIERTAELGIGNRVLFAGFLSGDEVDKAYRMADVYVMPSVSEPFGITPLEAMRNNVPVIISKQSGVSEVLKHCLKVDFWDIDKMASQILALIHYRALHNELSHHGSMEVRTFNWDIPAEKCMNIYNKILQGAS